MKFNKLNTSAGVGILTLETMLVVAGIASFGGALIVFFLGYINLYIGLGE